MDRALTPMAKFLTVQQLKAWSLRAKKLWLREQVPLSAT